MIRLTQDGKTLVVVGSWEEMFARPGFKRVVDAKTVSLKEMIGDYAFPTMDHCGLKGCRTKHNKGYLVLVGDDGDETNIGNICGKRHFGLEEFMARKRSFQQAVNAQRFRENITATQMLVPEFLRRVQALSNGDAAECYRKMTAQFTRLLDEQSSRALKRKAKLKDGRVTRAVRLSQEEQEFGLGFRADAEYRTDVLFTISGVEAPLSYGRLSSGRLDTLNAEIETFAKLDAQALGYMDLKKHNHWANRIDKTIDDLDEVLVDCQRFLTPSNIANILRYKEDLRRS